MKWLWGKYSLVIILFLSIFSIQSIGQTIDPPHIVCINTFSNGDIEITWEVPAENCGPFVSYNLYFSTNAGGPFSQIATITNPAQTTYLHVSAIPIPTDVVYYFMDSSFNCPGEPSVNSPIVDNLLPNTPALVLVTVDSLDNVQFLWEQSTSPETQGYIIYNNILGSTLPLDTVFGADVVSYYHTNSGADTASIAYTIAPIDGCDVPGLFNEAPHNTVHLTAITDNCADEIFLDWTEYINWPVPVNEYVLMVSRDGADFEPIQSFQNNQFNWNFIDELADSICIEIWAVAQNGVQISRSNRVCLELNISQPPLFHYVRNVTINELEQVLIEYVVDSLSPFLSYDIYRGEGKIDSSSIFAAPVQPLTSLVGIQDTIDIFAQTDFIDNYYQLIVIDSCFVEHFSNYARTINLKAFPQVGNLNELNWNPYENEYGIVQQYTIFRQDELGNFDVIATVDADTYTFLDEIAEVEPTTDGGYCYKIQATIDATFPDGLREFVRSSSNTACVFQPPKVFIPNAFVPEGVNNTFKPVLLYVDAVGYNFKVYNRYGGIIFETGDQEAAWDGRYKGDLVQQGVYPYSLKFTSSGGTESQRTGTVTVIR